jgi:putative transposase
VLDYIVTSNHVHLLVRDTKARCIARSMQLIAGRVAQEYNNRKRRRGAFWEDRYFATAIATDWHLVRCLTYIDLNMVRAGVVDHPSQWKASGYQEIHLPRTRYRVIDMRALCELTNSASETNFRRRHFAWVEEELARGDLVRRAEWTESVAVGPCRFRAHFRT